MDPSQQPEHPRAGGCRQHGVFSIRDLYMFFFRVQKWAKNGDFGGFSDLIQIPMGVMRSNLVRSGQTTSLVHEKAII